MVNDERPFGSRAHDSGLAQSEMCVDIAVNGTLMRGLELEPNLLNIGATFVREDLTDKEYRLFSIDDVHPGMIRLPAPGFEKVSPVRVIVEIWSIPLSGISTLLKNEPAGLSIGKVKLADGKTEVLGVIAEPALVNGKKDISNYPGNGVASFRDYIIREGIRIIDEELNKSALNDERLATIRTYRDMGELLYANAQHRGAIFILNHAVKMLDHKSRLYQNIQTGNARPQYTEQNVLS